VKPCKAQGNGKRLAVFVFPLYIVLFIYIWETPGCTNSCSDKNGRSATSFVAYSALTQRETAGTIYNRFCWECVARIRATRILSGVRNESSFPVKQKTLKIRAKRRLRVLPHRLAWTIASLNDVRRTWMLI